MAAEWNGGGVKSTRHTWTGKHGVDGTGHRTRCSDLAEREVWERRDKPLGRAVCGKQERVDPGHSNERARHACQT